MNKPTDKILDGNQGEINNQTNSNDNFKKENKNADSLMDDSLYSSESGNEEDDESSGENSFMELYEKSLKSIQEGELVTGEIVMIGKEYVLVDVGYKSEGQISINEFIDADGNMTAKVGDKIDVLLEKREV
jgi:small subunit ribosomal protein S1